MDIHIIITSTIMQKYEQLDERIYIHFYTKNIHIKNTFNIYMSQMNICMNIYTSYEHFHEHSQERLYEH